MQHPACAVSDQLGSLCCALKPCASLVLNEAPFRICCFGEQGWLLAIAVVFAIFLFDDHC